MTTLLITLTTGQFDSTTIVPDTATFEKVAGTADTYELKDLNGADFASVGMIPWKLLVDKGIVSRPAAYLPRVGHNGGAAGVTSFRANVMAEISAAAHIIAGPILAMDPSGASGASAGPLAITGQDELLRLDSNATGAQVAVIEIIPIADEKLVDLEGDWNTANVAESEYVGVALPNLLTSAASVFRLRWAGPSVLIDEISVVSNQAVAGAALVVTASIGGVAVTNGAVTVPVAAAGTSGVATPTAANQLNDGDILELTIGGGNTTASSEGAALIKVTPL